VTILLLVVLPFATGVLGFLAGVLLSAAANADKDRARFDEEREP
jgi:hypothetical protein